MIGTQPRRDEIAATTPRCEACRVALIPGEDKLCSPCARALDAELPRPWSRVALTLAPRAVA
ncbi:MAG TPA: hypothetical protein VEA38_04150 [Terriglobales bacterium]|nr:hypothetical protein [Terriglobales bacterium]